MLETSKTCQSGMTFIELASQRPNAGMTEPIRDEAFLIALQLQPCADFDLYADGRLIRPRGFAAGSVALFDLRANLAMDRRDPFHAIDLYIPRRALNALADDANTFWVDELRHEPGRALADPVARHLLLAARPALSAQQGASALFIDQIAMALATHVAHTYGSMRTRPEVKTGALARWQERRARELIAANLAGNLTLADLASACELSIRHFTRAFRQSTGMSPHAWLLQLRVEKAKNLLATSRHMLAEIALDCGFSDQSHMTRVFQRYLGVTPAEWRRLQQR
ncbi:AraC family transcriptional regulator [Salinisphaera sp. SPP-AMP-43]|uniref:helix-turn-helix domain-containing protein n=1 Tax=Salinisphaera sp. SPP-AMP-43 TaxID=3121288 RepID=UPI003C6E4831